MKKAMTRLIAWYRVGRATGYWPLPITRHYLAHRLGRNQSSRVALLHPSGMVSLGTICDTCGMIDRVLTPRPGMRIKPEALERVIKKKVSEGLMVGEWRQWE